MMNRATFKVLNRINNIVVHSFTDEEMNSELNSFVEKLSEKEKNILIKCLKNKILNHKKFVIYQDDILIKQQEKIIPEKIFTDEGVK